MKARQIIIVGIGIVVVAGITSMIFTKSLVKQQSINVNPTESINFINSDEAKKIMLDKVKEGNIIEFEYDSDEVNPKYKGTLIKDNIEYDIEVNAKTGEIVNFNEENIAINNTNKQPQQSQVSQASNTTKTQPQNNTTNHNNITTQSSPNTQVNNTQSYSSNIGEQKAKDIMLSKVPGAYFKSFYFDAEENEYDGELIKDNIEYDIEVNASTGAIVKFDKDLDISQNKPKTQSSNSNIGEQKAKDIMLGKVPGASFKSFYFDAEENEYDGELIKGNLEYDIEVNAKTGAVVKFDKDYIDKYDDDRYDDDGYDD